MASRTKDLDKKTNPAKRFLDWKNIQTVKVVDGEEFKRITDGSFQYYDKEVIDETTGKGTTIPIPKPFTFAVLNTDCKNFHGWDKVRERNVWSNEVFESGQTVTLKCKEGDLMSFQYRDYQNKDKKEGIKAKLKDFGAKYTQSVYIAVLGDSGWEIWNIQMNKGALTGGIDPKNMKPDEKQDGWINFAKSIGGKIFSHMITIENVKFKQNGDVKFCIPVFELGNPIDKEDSEALMLLSKELDEYLEHYAKHKDEYKDEQPVEEAVEQDEFA